jgi:hypothetical protein
MDGAFAKIIQNKNNKIVCLLAFAVPTLLNVINLLKFQGFSDVIDICPKNMPIYWAVSCRINAYAEECLSVTLLTRDSI